MHRLHLENPTRTCSVFPSRASFVAHVKKHLLSKEEAACWAYVLKTDSPHWQSLGNAPEQGDWGAQEEQAYKELADAIENGVKYAVKTPVHLVATERVTGHAFAVTRLTRMYLGEDGLLIVEARGAIRTAYFATQCTKGTPSRWEVFRLGMRSLRARAMAIESRQSRYLADENRWSVGISVERVKPENFSNRINPWPRPADAGMRRKVRKAYLDQLDAYRGKM
jgi:hypothetical protein